MNRILDIKGLPAIVGAVCVAALVVWLATANVAGIDKRMPGADDKPEGVGMTEKLPQLRGEVSPGDGVPSTVEGMWPQFRGPNLTAISEETTPLSRDWGDDGPPMLWELALGQGFAGAAVRNGRVYVIDYDEEAKADVIRCLSLDDGRDIWRFSYPIKIKFYHGMSRP